MTLESIAKLAGVSKVTVHRAINHPERVSADTLEKIRKAIAQTGYVPLALRKKAAIRDHQPRAKCGTIGVLFYDIRKNSPLTAHLLHGLDVFFADNQLNLVLIQFDGSGALPGSIQKSGIDGLIIRPGIFSDQIWKKLPKNIPSVWLFEKRRGILPEGVDSVIPDDRAVGEIALEYLYHKGRRVILIINAWPGHPAAEERILFFKNYADQFGMEVQLLNTVDINRQQILPVLSDRPGLKGIFFVGDTAHLMQLYNLMHEAGIQIGRDADMVTCSDDTEFLARFNRRIAVIDIQGEVIAQTAAETLRWRIGSPEASVRKILIEPRLLADEAD